MQVSLKLLTTYRSKLPEGTVGNTCQVEISEETQVNDILRKFNIPTDASSVVLVNGRTPGENQLLQEGDEICVYSAMAGG